MDIWQFLKKAAVLTDWDLWSNRFAALAVVVPWLVGAAVIAGALAGCAPASPIDWTARQGG